MNVFNDPSMLDIAAYRDELEGWTDMHAPITLTDNAENPVTVGTLVVAIYPEGDCDTGRVIAVHPDRYFGTVDVLLLDEDMPREFLIENVISLDAPDWPEIGVPMVW
jgi:hypothetical protein